ncbi:cytochrome P450 [Mycolicibacterium sp. Dal123E01]|uniref:cytochrome P450 n=1 Tax=Mycolicibacterium sp. Dal123E01 TaxID=3457578 RepID=UPI00403EA061
MTIPETAPRLPWEAADPYPYYERRREEGSVVWDETATAWLVLGYHPAQQILGSSSWTSDPLANPNAPAAFRMAGADIMRRNMLTTDGHDHLRLRNAVRDVFTRSFIAGLAVGIEDLAAATIDSVAAGVEFDFMAEIALPLPIAVAAAWLNLDVDTARLLREESPAIARMLGDFADPDTVEEGTSAFATLLTELLPLAADRRMHPADDLLSFIGAATDLELDDVVITAVLIAVAGHETTANLLGSAMVRLLSGEVTVVDDQLVTELLRLDGPVQAVARTATADQMVDGVAIRAGDPMLVVLAAANRDPAVFLQPNDFRPGRSGPAPLSFGYGAHYCLGAALARLEIFTALQHVLARGPVLCGAPSWRDTPAIRGPLTLPIAFAN